MMTNAWTDNLTSTMYRSYLVRFEQSAERGCRRVSVHCVETGITMLFDEIEPLLAFLQAEIERQEQKDGANLTLATSAQR